jgi:hypothetical protein
LIYCDLDNDTVNFDYNEDMKKSDIIPLQRIRDLIETLNKKSNFFDKEKLKDSNNIKENLCDIFSNKIEYEIIKNPSNSSVISERENLDLNKDKNITRKHKGNYITKSSVNNSIKNNDNFDSDIKNIIYDFNLSLFEAYDEDKHYTIDPNDQDKTFDKNKFICDSKHDIKAFLDTIKDRQVKLILY